MTAPAKKTSILSHTTKEEEALWFGPVACVCRFVGRPLTICDRMLVCSYIQSILRQGGLVVLAASASSELALCEGRKFESSSTTKLVTLRKSLQSLEDTKDYLGGSIKCLWIWLKGARRQLVWTRRNDCVWERDAWQVVLQSVAATPSAVCFRPMSR